MDKSVKQTSATHLEHGGNTLDAQSLFACPKGDWLDLSTGINPYSYPMPDLSEKCCSRLPETASYDKLCRAAAEYYGVADTDFIAPAPGTQAIIQWLPRLLCGRRRIAVVGPTYNEHAHACEIAGHKVSEVKELDDIDQLVDVIIVVNPNNPDGRIINTDKLLGLAAKMAARNAWLVVDEAFADLAPETSLAAMAGMPGLVVLRSFGKFFGLAGLRLGFALGGAELMGRLRRALGPWAVSGPAIEIGTTALADTEWIETTRKHLQNDSRRLNKLLMANALQIIGATDLFSLVKTTDAAQIYERLARRGILVRKFSRYPHWLRFGLPGNKSGWKRLEDAFNTP